LKAGTALREGPESEGHLKQFLYAVMIKMKIEGKKEGKKVRKKKELTASSAPEGVEGPMTKEVKSCGSARVPVPVIGAFAEFSPDV